MDLEETVPISLDQSQDKGNHDDDSLILDVAKMTSSPIEGTPIRLNRSCGARFPYSGGLVSQSEDADLNRKRKCPSGPFSSLPDRFESYDDDTVAENDLTRHEESEPEVTTTATVMEEFSIPKLEFKEDWKKIIMLTGAIAIVCFLISLLVFAFANSDYFRAPDAAKMAVMTPTVTLRNPKYDFPYKFLANDFPTTEPDKDDDYSHLDLQEYEDTLSNLTQIDDLNLQFCNLQESPHYSATRSFLEDCCLKLAAFIEKNDMLAKMVRSLKMNENKGVAQPLMKFLKIAEQATMSIRKKMISKIAYLVVVAFVGGFVLASFLASLRFPSSKDEVERSMKTLYSHFTPEPPYFASFKNKTLIFENDKILLYYK